MTKPEPEVCYHCGGEVEDGDAVTMTNLFHKACFREIYE